MKTEEEEEEKIHLFNDSSLTETLVLNEKLVNEVEKCGFPKSYICNSLNNDDMNYATTFYYLLEIQKEYWFSS